MSDGRPQTTRLIRQHRGVPVYGYRSDPSTPPVSVLRLGPGQSPERAPHIHDFPVLVHVPAAHEVYVVTPGQVVDVGHVPLPEASTTVFFDPGALGAGSRSPWPTWYRHPLLAAFLHGHANGLLRVPLPPGHPLWTDTMAAIETELEARREGFQQAALAHLTLLLIDLARLTADIPGEFRLLGEPLLADVFEVIDRRFGEPLSLRDVAAAVGVTPGHLTTLVRRRTGRTVQDWITERRMAHARELLGGTDLPVAVIASRVGLPDPSYFGRVFRRAHDCSPRAWRNQLHGDSHG
ncbi:helix-turn-helix transcriptional regulator [Nocardia sp. NPDC057353]|uniref:helix-turn-helix transcriptional regulator n=1 Tax=Nocardia sp. NPDC057353 TaxID=3346104 RepID=UPI00362E5EA3